MTHFKAEKMISFVQDNWPLHIHSAFELRNRDKFIVELADVQQNHYILKGEKSDAIEVNNIAQFANSLQTILPVAHYIASNNTNYCVQMDDYIFTVESKLVGHEIDGLTDSYIQEIAAQLGKMHSYSVDQNFRLNKATSWSMFGGNKTMAIGDYDENELSFQNFTKNFRTEPNYAQILSLYEQYRSSLKKLWPHLPKAATQGDFCHYNMLFEDEKLVALFDFNLAGDEVLINECVAVGIYLCWHVAYSGPLTENERFNQFLNYYREQRKWTDLEHQAFPYLFAIIRAFRFDRVDRGIAEIENRHVFIEDTIQILTRCYVEKIRNHDHWQNA